MFIIFWYVFLILILILFIRSLLLPDCLPQLILYFIQFLLFLHFYLCFFKSIIFWILLLLIPKFTLKYFVNSNLIHFYLLNLIKEHYLSFHHFHFWAECLANLYFYLNLFGKSILFQCVLINLQIHQTFLKSFWILLA